MLWADVMSDMLARGVMCDVRDARQDQARWLSQSLWYVTFITQQRVIITHQRVAWRVAMI